MVPARKSSTGGNGSSKRGAKVTRKRNAPQTANEPPLTPEELEAFNELLLVKRRELLGDVDHMCGEALSGSRHDSTGDLSTMPIHMADVGSDNYEQEFTLGLIEGERQQLRAIDIALDKIGAGKYGICEGTGKQINRARLMACPETRFCIDYARLIEQGKASANVGTAKNEDDEE